MKPEMKPFDQRTPDTQYREILRKILAEGVRVPSQQGVDALTYMAPGSMHFKMANGFPMLTERNLAPKENPRLPVTIWRQAIAEIIGFVNGARTLEQLAEFGCHWWEPWGTEAKTKKRGLETGDLGPGSYGAAFHDFPTSEGESFNQFATIVQQILQEPQLRTHFISPWIPQYTARVEGRTQKVVVCPCHGWIHLRVIENKLTLHMMQRSGDVPVGVPANMVQYAALLMMIAQATGLEAYEYIHTISDAHIYVDQVPAVETMLAREPRAFPTMNLTTENTDLFKFRHTDFELSDYNPHPGIKQIPVAI
jgi:thymidylate synthase